MKMKLSLTLLLLACSYAQASGIGRFQARIGAGTLLSPQDFSMVGQLEYRPDPWFSLGPSMQWSISNNRDMFFPSLGGRFILPKRFWEEVFGEESLGFESSLRLGMGTVFREINGFRFVDFGFEAGLNLDFFVTDHISLGAAGIVTLTSSNADSSFGSLLGTISYLF